MFMNHGVFYPLCIQYYYIYQYYTKFHYDNNAKERNTLTNISSYYPNTNNGIIISTFSVWYFKNGKKKKKLIYSSVPIFKQLFVWLHSQLLYNSI